MRSGQRMNGVRPYAHRDAARSSRLSDAACVRLTHTGRTYITEKLLPGAFLDSPHTACASWKLRGAS